jgi:deoxycytidine triphosphate deaminase
MSVISVRARRTSELALFDRNRKSDASLLFTDAAQISEFSVELTLGELYDDELSETRAIMYAIDKDVLTLRPGKSIVVEVAEHLRVPNNMFGVVMPKGHILLEQGILMASTKIEPSYDGHLRLLLHNSSGVRRTLRRDSVIASAVFFRTERTLEGDSLTSREPVSRKPRGMWRSLGDFVTADPRFVLMFLATLLSSVAAALLTVWLTVKKPQ